MVSLFVPVLQFLVCSNKANNSFVWSVWLHRMKGRKHVFSTCTSWHANCTRQNPQGALLPWNHARSLDFRFQPLLLWEEGKFPSVGAKLSCTDNGILCCVSGWAFNASRSSFQSSNSTYWNSPKHILWVNNWGNSNHNVTIEQYTAQQFLQSPFRLCSVPHLHPSTSKITQSGLLF